MTTLLTFAFAALAFLAGCSSTATAPTTQIDAEYEYGTIAGRPQRPAPDSY